MSNLLQTVDDDCQTIDNIYKCLEELENQRDLTLHVQNQIQKLKFELRNLRIHFKWRTFSFDLFSKYTFNVLSGWVTSIEEFLEPTRKGCMTIDLMEKKISSLLMRMERAHFRDRRCSLWIDMLPFNSDYTNAHITDVLDWIDQLVDNLKHLIRWNEFRSVVSAGEKIETLVEKIGFLRNLLEIAGMEIEEVIKNGTPMLGLLHKTSGDLLIRIKRLIYIATYLSWVSCDDQSIQKFFLILLDDIDHIEAEIRMTCAQLLKDSKIANPRTIGIDLQALAAVDSLLDNLQKLLKDQDNGSFMHLSVHEIEILCQELGFLKYFLMHPHVKQHKETEAHSFMSLLIQVEAVARELGTSLTLSDCFGGTEAQLADEIHLVHTNLLKILNLLKIKIREMYLSIPRKSTSNFPRSPKLGFVNFFIQSLEELLHQRADSIAYVKDEVKTLLSELTLLSSFIKDTTMNLEKNENIANQIMDVAYEAEQVIDLISSSHFPKWYYIMWLSNVIEKTKILRTDCSEVHTKMPCEINHINNATSNENYRQGYNMAIEKEMVGFHAESKTIIDQLTRGTKQLDILSIVGMPGLGKTTLAKKVYEHPSITSYFHVRSWYCISQVYDRQDLLHSILGDLSQWSSEWNDECMAEVLYKSLKGMRYLIVLDDIWSIEPWNDIRNSFPDDCNGSRILFTSRLREVALQANPRSAPPHDLRLLSDEESWEILDNKVFKQRSYPPEIYTIGKKIAENCKGLPLSVVLVAGVLVKLEESEDHWKQILASLGKQVGDLSKSILELSYKQLPDHLKPCFLYFLTFPEDKEIPTRKLIRLWIAEGFIQKKTEYESLENVAEEYLMDLTARSLVLIAQSKSSEGIKTCHVHDLLHEFSMEKAKDENFLRISREIPYDLGSHRQCFYFDVKSLYGWIPNYDPYIRSVFFYSIIRVTDRLFCDGPVVLSHSLKLLRVLDLQSFHINNHQFQRLTELLVHPRYLAIEGPVDHIPSSLANLWRLETFILKGTNSDREVKFPEALLEMAYLKHVYVDNVVVIELSDHPEKSIRSACIEKLSTLCVYDHNIHELMRRLRSLRKLKCRFSEICSWGRRRHHQLLVLHFLSEVESLNIKYHNNLRFPAMITLSECSFPSNLKKLTLTNFRLPWSEISNIERLPQLKVLKLLSGAFRGHRWDASDVEFRNLKFLKLQCLDIKEWDASPDAFPCLEQLVLEDCFCLKEIPSSFGESNTLRMIKVKKCKKSIAKAVLKIEKDLLDLGTEGFKLLFQN